MYDTVAGVRYLGVYRAGGFVSFVRLGARVYKLNEG